MMRSIALAVATLLAGCAREPDLSPAPPLDEAAVIAASLPIAQAFQAELQGQLRAALAAGGPEAAIAVCQQAAPAIAAAQSEASGARVSRVAERHRNPAGGVPEYLRAAYVRLAAKPLVDGKPNRLVVQTGSGSGAKVHFLAAIPMQDQPCSTCHGTALDPALKAQIERLYPGDLAFGFKPGELRGVLLITWQAESFRK